MEREAWQATVHGVNKKSDMTATFTFTHTFYIFKIKREKILEFEG